MTSPKCLDKPKKTQSKQSALSPTALRPNTIRSVMLTSLHSLHNQLFSPLNTITTSANDNRIITIPTSRNINITTCFLSDNTDSLTSFADDEMMMFGRDTEVTGTISLILH
jgi:hypothetical protein